MQSSWKSSATSKFTSNPLYTETFDGKKLMKAIVLGNGCSGKSSVVRHFMDMGFSKDYRPTAGVEFVSKDIQDTLRYQIWDMPGDDRFMKIAASYFKGCHMFVLVFDVTNKNSLESLGHIEKMIQQEAKDHHSILLIANKTDLPGRQVNTEEAEQYAKNRGYQYLELSCKEVSAKEKVQKAFEQLLWNHVCVALPITNFSDDNYARSLHGTMYQTIISQVNKMPLN